MAEKKNHRIPTTALVIGWVLVGCAAIAVNDQTTGYNYGFYNQAAAPVWTWIVALLMLASTALGAWGAIRVINEQRAEKLRKKIAKRRAKRERQSPPTKPLETVEAS